MTSTKCSKCGLVNFSRESQCKRCGENLKNSPSNNSNAAEDFVNDSLPLTKDFTNENRKIGFFGFIFGIVCSIAPWILTFNLDFMSRKLNAGLMVFGLSLVVVGIGTIASPPKSKLTADENKSRQGLLFLIGLILGLIEAYFFNKALGFW